MPTTQSDLRAALDLGSNSFHLLLVKPEGAGFVVVERLKEKVQLLGGFKQGEIQEASMQRGFACLARFGQRLRPVARENIRVVGTSCLRQADNREAFIARAQAILGVPVEVISGAEEARLAYLGVAHHLQRSAHERLVIDIGGGSTEFALGASLATRATGSVNVGCVALTDEHFADLHLQSSGYRAAKAAAIERLSRELEGSAVIGDKNLGDVYGTSGTIESVAMVLQANGWVVDDITQEGLSRLEEAIVADRWIVDAGLPGLSPDRVDIFPAGVAILSACFEVLGLARMQFVDVTLMQGMICDALVLDESRDRCAQSVAALAERFAVDANQARRVAHCAQGLYAQSREWWCDDEEWRRLLGWGAQLHEIGAHIGARHYHRHGAYIVKHADLAGFSRLQQRALALLVRGHRRSFPGLAFRAFDPEIAKKLIRLVSLLRIAVILERSHNDADSPSVTLEVAQDELRLATQADWLAEHPLSQRELEMEAAQLASAGLKLTVA